MKEIKIVFKKENSNRLSNDDCAYFDVYIDGEKEHDVKRFWLDLSNEPKEHFDTACDFSYGIEHFIDVSDLYLDR